MKKHTMLRHFPNSYILLYIIFLCSLCSCKTDDSITTKLDAAQNIIHADPEQALELIRSINQDHIKDDETEARYALLYSRILYTNEVKVESDSLISTAVSYYGKYGSSKEKAQSYYNLGLI